MAGKIIFSISDIHTEFEKEIDISKFPFAHILILAGDIGNPTTHCDVYKNFLIQMKQLYSDVIFVAGNHEFYGCDYNKKGVIDKLKTLAEQTGTHFLYNESRVIQGVEFVGCTLWSLIDKSASKYISDFGQDVFFTQTEYVSEFIDQFRFLQAKLKDNTKHPRVVITHHLPTSSLIHKKFKDNPINSAFYTDILDEVNCNDVKYWFCGHTHEYGFYKYGDTYFVVNPIGYPGEKRDTLVSYKTYLV